MNLFVFLCVKWNGWIEWNWAARSIKKSKLFFNCAIVGYVFRPQLPNSFNSFHFTLINSILFNSTTLYLLIKQCFLYLSFTLLINSICLYCKDWFMNEVNWLMRERVRVEWRSLSGIKTHNQQPVNWKSLIFIEGAIKHNHSTHSLLNQLKFIINSIVVGYGRSRHSSLSWLIWLHWLKDKTKEEKAGSSLSWRYSNGITQGKTAGMEERGESSAMEWWRGRWAASRL